MLKDQLEFIKPKMPSAFLLMRDYISITRSNRYTNFGPKEVEFRKRLGDIYRYKTYFITTSNATIGLSIAIQNLFSNPNDKNIVLMPSFTFAAAACVLKSLGYTIAFYDIREHDLQPDLDSAQEYITQNHKKIAGIIYCNTFGVGYANNIALWLKAARQIPMIIDSAAGYASKYENNEPLGRLGSCEVFSFHATKTMAIGEGGAISTTDKRLSSKFIQSSNFGFNQNRETTVPGLNGKLQEFNSAIGIRQLKRLERTLTKKLNLVEIYITHLNTSFKVQPGSNRSSLAFLSVICASKTHRDVCMNKLEENNIPTRNYYSPILSKHLLFKKSKVCSTLEITNKISSTILSLPLYESMKKKDVIRICKIMNSVIPNNS